MDAFEALLGGGRLTHSSPHKTLTSRSPVWTKLYRGSIEAELHPRHTDMLSAFREAVQRCGPHPALHFFDQTTSFQLLDAQSDALACWFIEHGVVPEHRVLFLSQNMPAFVIIMLATWKVGAVPVPVNPMYRSQELGRMLTDAEPAIVLCETDAAAELTKAMSELDLQNLPMVVFASDVDGQAAQFDASNSLANILEQNKGKAPLRFYAGPEDLGLILYTSGTTGAPKGAMITQAALAFNGQFVKEWFDLSPDSRMFAMAPFFHITGFVSHLCAALVAGCCNILNYRFSPVLAVEMIRKWQPTHTVGAITAINSLSTVPNANSDSLACFREVYSGGAPIPPSLKEKLETDLGFRIHPVYGMTELAGPAIFTPFGHDAPVVDGHMSIGIPIPSTELSVVDQNYQEVPCGQVGELLIRGPQVMKGYWRNPEDSALTIKDGWLCTGDVGFMDAEGWVYLVDRKKDVIIASGFKVWPREVEDVLYEHPAVREAAVIGVEDAYRGETVKAFVSLENGAQITSQEIVDHCRLKLTGYKVPRHIEILSDLPKTVSGKIQRSELREGH